MAERPADARNAIGSSLSFVAPPHDAGSKDRCGLKSDAGRKIPIRRNTHTFCRLFRSRLCSENPHSLPMIRYSERIDGMEEK